MNRTLRRAGALATAASITLLAAATIGATRAGADTAPQTTVQLTSSCLWGLQTVTATIHNARTDSTETATVDPAHTGDEWRPGATVVQPIASTTMIRTMPGDSTDTIGLGIDASWADGATEHADAQPITLPGGCTGSPHQPPPVPMFNDQTDCTTPGTYTIPEAPGLTYQEDGTTRPAGTYRLAVNARRTIAVKATDPTGHTLLTWRHTYTIDLANGCYQPGTVQIHATARCGGPVFITGSIGRNGLPTPLRINDTLPTGDGWPVPSADLLMKPGQPFRIVYRLPESPRTSSTQPDVVQVMLHAMHIQIDTSDLLLTIRVNRVCATQPAAHSQPVLHAVAHRHSTTTAAPQLASTGTPAWQQALIAAVLITLGLGCVRLGRRPSTS